MWNELIFVVVWSLFHIVLFWDWNENWSFPVLWSLLSFPICWHIKCSTLIASYFRIRNNSAGLLSPLLALFVVTLPKAHLTSHSRVFSCRWVTTPFQLCGSLWLFLYHSFVYSCHLFLISSASLSFHSGNYDSWVKWKN